LIEFLPLGTPSKPLPATRQIGQFKTFAGRSTGAAERDKIARPACDPNTPR
jgi:hypothetical protein